MHLNSLALSSGFDLICVCILRKRKLEIIVNDAANRNAVSGGVEVLTSV